MAGITFGDALRKYRDSRCNRWSPKYLYNFELSSRIWNQVIGTREISEIKPEDILDIRNALDHHNSGWWTNTVRGYLTAFCNWAIACGWLTRNPVSPQIWPYDVEITRRTISDFTKEEVELLYTHLEIDDKRFVALACYTGLRIGTLSRLLWRHLVGDFLHIPREILKTRRYLTGDQRLYVPVACLRIILPQGPPDDPILKLHGDLAYRLKSAAKSVGIDPHRVYPHAFRRTWCSWMVKAGATREEVMQIQGWKDSSILLQHYWPRVSDVRQKNIMEKL
jgi:integrase